MALIGQAIRDVIQFLGHQLNSTIGVGILAGSVAYSISGLLRFAGIPLRDNYQLVTGTPYYPSQIIMAVMVGLSLALVLQHRAMLWVWILPSLQMGYLVATNTTVLYINPAFGPKIDQTRWSHFFGWGCMPDNPCPDQLVTTVPFYAAAAYSIGALLARKMAVDASSRTKFWIVFIGGILILVPFIQTVLFSGYYAVTDSQLLAETYSSLWRTIGLAWWTLPLMVALLAFPLAMGGFLVRSAFRFRKQH